MNCRPGDVAVVVKPAMLDLQGELVVAVRPGTVVRVVALAPDEVDVWDLEEPIEFRVANSRGSWMLGEVEGLGDHYLRPLRPGELSQDEVDELFAPQLPEVV